MSNKSPFKALQFPTVRLLALSLFLAQTSNQMQIVAINWHMYEQTHSPLNLGLLGLSGFLPIFLFSLVGGTIADRFNKKKILTIAQIFLAINSGILFLATLFHFMSPLLLYAIFAANSVIATISVPSRQSMLPMALPKEYFLNGVSFMTTVWQITVICGPTIAGFLIGLSGPQSVYFSAIVGFILSMIVLASLHFENAKPVERVPVNLSSMLEGLRYVFKTPLIYSTMLVDFFATFFASASTLMPIFAKDILHVGPQGLGLLYAAPAAGALIMGVALSAKHSLNNQGKLLMGSVFLYGVSMVAFGFSKIFLLSLVFLAISGASDMLSAVIRNTIRQMITPDNLRGRMTAVNMTFFIGGPYLGEVEAGVAATLFGTPLSVALGGVGTIALTFLVAFFVPKLLRYKAHNVEV